MTQLDVRQLSSNGPFPSESFPAARRAEFRVYIAPHVHEGIAKHASADVSVEICGVLVGLWKQDADGPYAAITEYIRCEGATSKFAEVTFTHESWAQINREMDSKYVDLRVIGWYHSHPDFGIFLSDRDCFIQEHFFSGPGQVAYVVDPVRKLEGFFEWRDGKPVPVSQYWVGDRVLTVQASREAVTGGLSDNAPRMTAASAPAPASEGSSLGLLTLLSWTCLFLLGYLIGDVRTKWEQQRLEQGAAANFALNKLMRTGLEPKLLEVRALIVRVHNEIQPLLSSGSAELNEQQKKDLADRKQRINRGLLSSHEILLDIEEQYGLTPAELSEIEYLRKLAGEADSKAKAPAASTEQKKPEPAAKEPLPTAPSPGASP